MKYLIISIWLGCGLLAAGLFNASMDDGYKWTTKDKCLEWATRDQSMSILLGIGGPLSLAAALGLTGFGYRGWSLYRHECNY